MDLPLKLVNVIGLQFSDGAVPAFVDQIQTFVFVGGVTPSQREEVIQCATEMVMNNSDDGVAVDVDETFRTGSYNGDNSSVEYTEGSVSIHW